MTQLKKREKIERKDREKRIEKMFRVLVLYDMRSF